MPNLISKCNTLLKNCGFFYAYCGGYSFELFLNKKLRSHGDIDIIILEQDKKNAVEFFISNGWNIYSRNEHGELKLIMDCDDKDLSAQPMVWAIKPDCSTMRLEPVEAKKKVFTYEIINNELLQLDYIEVIFGAAYNGEYICDREKCITRELGKAFLSNCGTMYLAPEIKLFYDSKPRYMELDYFKEKNRIDYEAVIPFVSRESKLWLIDALERKYPEGNRRLEQVRMLV